MTVKYEEGKDDASLSVIVSCHGYDYPCEVSKKNFEGYEEAMLNFAAEGLCVETDEFGALH